MREGADTFNASQRTRTSRHLHATRVTHQAPIYTFGWSSTSTRRPPVLAAVPEATTHRFALLIAVSAANDLTSTGVCFAIVSSKEKVELASPIPGVNARGY